MGALIGAFYSAGYSPLEIEDIIRKSDWKAIYSDVAPRTERFLTQKQDTEGYLFRARFGSTGFSLPTGYSKGMNVQGFLSIILHGRIFFHREISTALMCAFGLLQLTFQQANHMYLKKAIWHYLLKAQ
jgi:predicted acylesterase/phospholipase RssA